MRIRNIVWIHATIAMLVVAGSGSAVRAEEGKTVAATQVALQRECSARKAYLAYAEKADEECCREAAALFRALATAEDVHARNHTLVLEQLGVIPETIEEPIVVGTTVENLRAAIDAEVFERKVAYRQFMTYASEECLYDALASFRYARNAEMTHAIRLSLALARLEDGGPMVASASVDATPAEAGITYYVCMGCGCVRSESPARHCECGTGAAQRTTFVAAEWPPMPALVAVRR
jgi:rubrerythrin